MRRHTTVLALACVIVFGSRCSYRRLSDLDGGGGVGGAGSGKGGVGGWAGTGGSGGITGASGSSGSSGASGPSSTGSGGGTGGTAPTTCSISANCQPDRFCSEGRCVSDVVGVATGAWHTCTAHKDGKVFCWGDNSMGQLGVSQPALTARPVEVPALASVTKLSLGGDELRARLQQGGVLGSRRVRRAWRRNRAQQSANPGFREDDGWQRLGGRLRRGSRGLFCVRDHQRARCLLLGVQQRGSARPTEHGDDSERLRASRRRARRDPNADRRC